MKTANRVVAVVELLLISPAVLFMTALFVRNIQPSPYEPSEAARRLVDWYSTRPLLCLDVFLIAWPFLALVIGAATVAGLWRGDASLRRVTRETLTAVRSHAAALVIAAATLIAAGTLAIVAMHMIAD